MDNYYAVDRYEHPELRDLLVEEILASSDDGHWFALIDKAFDHGTQPFGSLREIEYPLYRTGRLEALGNVSPCLVRLSAVHPKVLKKFLGRLLFHCRCRPMLSFLQTRWTAEQLAEDWQGLLEIETEDEQAFVLRFADTRALPELANCTTALWSELSGNINAWWNINRAGALEALPLAKIDAGRGTNPDRVRLNTAEFAALLESGLPDALAERLHEHFPDLLAVRGGFANYRLLRASCSLAKRHRIETFPDQMTLSVAVLLSHGSLLDDPQFDSWMEQKLWAGGTLEAALGNYLETIETTE